MGAFAAGTYLEKRRLGVAERKRWTPWLNILGTVGFMLVATIFNLQFRSRYTAQIVGLMVVVVGVLAYLNQKLAIVCDQCGESNSRQSLFEVTTSCSWCGARLDTAKPARGDDLLE